MSHVYFTNLRTHAGLNLQQKLENMIRHAGFDQLDLKDKYVAIKIHFGELGNMAYIRPNYAAVLVRMVREKGGKPFLTDANTLYTGSRSNAIDHLHTAMVNGFNPIVTDCDVIIADGLRGKDERIVPVDGKYCPEPKIGAAIAEADVVISMNHFKGHEMAGFGGALKNLGMGSGSVAGKQDMHATAQPRVVTDKCIGCKICEKNCAHDAIHVTPPSPLRPSPHGTSSEGTPNGGGCNRAKAVINYDNCVGCGQCVALCPREAAVNGSEESSKILNYKIDEYAKAVLKDKQHFHVSFIMNVSPECDCWAHNDAAIVPDLGMACSFDPVALDQACVDLVNRAPKLSTPSMLNDKDSLSPALTGTLSPNGEREDCDHHHHEETDHDKFHRLHPDTDWEAGLVYAEEIGLGEREYSLEEV